MAGRKIKIRVIAYLALSLVITIGAIVNWQAQNRVEAIITDLFFLMQGVNFGIWVRDRKKKPPIDPPRATVYRLHPPGGGETK